MLIYLGHEIVLAKDGAEAVLLYKESLQSEKPVDLTIMDLTIPGGIGGKHTVRKFQEIFELKEIEDLIDQEFA
jgi:CheY-like chemotaxis protein